MNPLRIGIDLGGSKIEIVVLDAEGVALLRRRVATPIMNVPTEIEDPTKCFNIAPRVAMIRPDPTHPKTNPQISIPVK